MGSTPAAPPPRERVEFKIPSSTITLDIFLRQDHPLKTVDVDACLSGALSEASQQMQTAIVEGAFRYPSEAIVTPKLQFSIIGNVFGDELTWADVKTILGGLQTFYHDRQEYVELLIYLSDEKRGPFGDAGLRLVEATIDEALGSGATSSATS